MLAKSRDPQSHGRQFHWARSVALGQFDVSKRTKTVDLQFEDVLIIKGFWAA
jgi:hypothetical protein